MKIWSHIIYYSNHKLAALMQRTIIANVWDFFKYKVGTKFIASDTVNSGVIIVIVLRSISNTLFFG